MERMCPNIYYHGTTKNNKEKILSEGFKSSYGRFGDGVYFTNDIDEAISRADDKFSVILMDFTDFNILEIKYEDLKKNYPYLDIDNEEGVPVIEKNEGKGFDGVLIVYSEDDKELCVYNTKKLNKKILKGEVKMEKSKLELILGDKFYFIEEDGSYFISKENLSKDKREKLILVIKEFGNSEIVITANIVSSLFVQKYDKTKQILEYWSIKGLCVEDILKNQENYELPAVYLDLYKEELYEEIDMLNLSDIKDIKEIKKEKDCKNSDTLIINVLKVLSSIKKFEEFAMDYLDLLESKTKYDSFSDVNIEFMDLGLIKKAINFEWESLMFESNIVLAKLDGPDGSVTLETTGEVRITDNMLDVVYVGADIFNNHDIVEAIRDGSIHTNDRFFIDNNNWFSMVFINKNNECVDDFLFESMPESIDEIISEMKKVYDYFTKPEDEEENKKRYLVSVFEDYCFNGQVVTSPYSLDSDDDDYLNDMRDFFGEFILKIQKASSMEEAISLVSKEYSLEKEMLNAYELA